MPANESPRDRAHDGNAGAPDDARLERVLAAGPRGALALAGIATAIVMAIWFAFYFLVFIPRGTIH